MAVAPKPRTRSSGKTPRQARSHRVAAQDDFDFQLPEFATDEEREAWLESLPKVEAKVDPRLKARVAVTLRLNQKEVEDFQALAELKGLSNGESLMYMVLNQYLVRNHCRL
jgi:hypothetical protein